MGSLGGSCERGTVSSPWEALQMRGGQLGQRGSSRGSEESIAAGLWQEQRDQCREPVPLPCYPQPQTCRWWCVVVLSAGTWVSKDRPRERIRVGCTETAWRGWSVVQAAAKEYMYTPSLPGKWRAIVSGCMKIAIAAPLLVCSQWVWLYLCELWECARAAGLPTCGSGAEIGVDLQVLHDGGRRAETEPSLHGCVIHRFTTQPLVPL